MVDSPTAKLPLNTFKLCLLGLAAFLLWQAWMLRSYTRQDTRPPAWDQAIHMEIAYDYRAAMAAGKWSDLWHLRPKPGMPPFPPLYHLGIVAAQGLLGSGSDPKAAADAALWLNWAYLVVLCSCLFGLAWEYLGDESALAATIAFACAPNVQWLLRNQLIDLPLVAWAVAAYWAYLKSDGFRSRRETVLCAMATASGFLHKWSFFGYLFPFVLAAWSARREPLRRRHARLAALIVAALCAPWYLANLPPLFPRLFQASADFAIPFWKDWSFLTYFLASAEELGVALFLLGWIGIVTMRLPKRAEWAWLLPEWVLLSYAFWTIVPNRQFRFLLPGLPALAILACGPFPKPAVWVMALLQILGAANYQAAWIKPVSLPLPLITSRWLISDSPKAEDWKLETILKEAAARRSPDQPFANLTLVANDVRFNGPTFNWIVKRLGLPIKIRGVNSRLSEFSQFVLLKRGNLGPGSVIGGLPEAQTVIETRGGWFERAYEEVRRWPLPDGSEAVLYDQRRPAAPPLKAGKLRVDFSAGAIDAKGLTLDVGPWDAQSSSYDWVRLSAGSVRIRGLAVTDFRATLERVRFVPLAGVGAPLSDVRLLKMATLKLESATIAAADLGRFAEERLRGLKVRSVALDGNALLTGTFRGIPIAAGVSLGLTHQPPGLYVGMSRTEIGYLGASSLVARLPPFLLGFAPTPELPFKIAITSIEIKEGRIRIGE